MMKAGSLCSRHPWRQRPAPIGIRSYSVVTRDELGMLYSMKLIARLRKLQRFLQSGIMSLSSRCFIVETAVPPLCAVTWIQ
jgi:hypothetical protein